MPPLVRTRLETSARDVKRVSSGASSVVEGSKSRRMRARRRPLRCLRADPRCFDTIIQYINLAAA